MLGWNLKKKEGKYHSSLLNLHINKTKLEAPGLILETKLKRKSVRRKRERERERKKIENRGKNLNYYYQLS